MKSRIVELEELVESLAQSDATATAEEKGSSWDLRVQIVLRLVPLTQSQRCRACHQILSSHTVEDVKTCLQSSQSRFTFSGTRCRDWKTLIQRIVEIVDGKTAIDSVRAEFQI